MIKLLLILLTIGTASNAVASDLQQKLRQLVSSSDGRIGVCILNFKDKDPVCVNGDQKFQLQSVMKLIVAAAVMDAVDSGLMKLDDKVVVKPEDASPGPQEFANLVKSQGGLEVTIEDLIKRAIVDSDSTSVDILLKRIDGPRTVQKFLERKQLSGIRIDRNERNVQADSVGLQWRKEYADLEKFETAAKSLPDKIRDAAWKEHLTDIRDSSTPIGMVLFLKTLASGKLLSETSTNKLLAIMKMTMTGPDRLMAGTPKGWGLAHKTGTGRTWKGVNAATNDVGILSAPDGNQIAVAVFVTESKKENAHRAKTIAQVAELAITTYRFEKARQ